MTNETRQLELARELLEELLRLVHREDAIWDTHALKLVQRVQQFLKPTEFIKSDLQAHWKTKSEAEYREELEDEIRVALELKPNSTVS